MIATARVMLAFVVFATACAEPDTTSGDDTDAPTADSTAAEAAMPGAEAYGDEPGVMVRVSSNPFEQTVAKARSAIEEAGFTIIATIDHAAAARNADMEIEPTTLLVFGNPAAGTALIEASPTSAIDLPLKVLIWQERNEYDEPIVRVAVNTADFIAWRHELPSDDETLGAMEAALATVVGGAISPR